MLKFLRSTFAIACVSFLAAGAALAADETLQAKKFPKAYASKEGVQVLVVELQPDRPRRVLLKISGIDHPWSGRPLLHMVQGDGGRLDYVTSVNGRDFVTLIARPGYDGSPRYTFYLTGVNGDMPLKYDAKLSQDANGDAVLADYLKTR